MGKSVYIKTDEGVITSDVQATLITFTMPEVVNVRLIELSLLPDSAFMSYGKMKIEIGGISHELDPQKLKQSLTIPLSTFNDEQTIDGKIVKGVVLNPGDTVKVLGNSDGTNEVKIDATLVGEVL